MSDYEKHILERIDVAVQGSISRNAIDFAVEKSIDYTVDSLVLRLRAFMWGEKSAPDDVIRYPTTWWDAVKQRWLPRWLLKRYPANYTVHRVRHKISYSNLLKNKIPTCQEYVVPIVYSDRWQE